MTDISLPRTTGRVGLAAGAAAFLALGLAAPAAADVETSDSSTRAQYVSNYESGVRVSMDGTTIGTTLFNLDVEGSDSVLTMYCIDFRTAIRSSAWYLEDDWANYPGEGDFAQPGKVHWILQNGYPAVDVDTLASKADTNRLNQQEALAATQAAIWYFSNDVDLDERNQPNVRALFDYFVENAEDLPQTAEPESTLKITPSEASGNAGEVIGEFTIETSASDVPVHLEAPEGVDLVDIESGESVGAVNNGDTVGFSVPEDADAGEASFSLQTTAEVRSGRLFRGESDEPTQTLVTAQGGEVTANADASVSWAEVDEPEPEEPEVPEESDEPEVPEESDEPDAPEDEKPTPEDEKDEPSLPVTGGALAGLVAAGVAALGAGGGALYMTRKRKASALDSDEG